MKTTLLLLVLSILTLSLPAQDRKARLTDEQRKELKAKLEVYKSRLNLSEEQQIKVDESNAKYLEALSAIKESGAGRLKRYNRFKQANSTHDKEMKAILTKEQYAVYKEMQDEFKDELRERKGK